MSTWQERAAELEIQIRKMIIQVDWLVTSAQYQNEVLKYLAEQAQEHRGDQSEGGNDQGGNGHAEGASP